MRLIELLDVINENTNVCVKKEGEIIAIYDGRNSIPIELSNEIVYQIYINELNIVIEIN